MKPKKTGEKKQSKEKTGDTRRRKKTGKEIRNAQREREEGVKSGRKERGRMK